MIEFLGCWCFQDTIVFTMYLKQVQVLRDAVVSQGRHHPAHSTVDIMGYLVLSLSLAGCSPLGSSGKSKFVGYLKHHMEWL